MGFVYFLIALVAIAIDIAFALYAGEIAEDKGYSKGNWIAVCLFFGIIGYILIAALPDLVLRAQLERLSTLPVSEGADRAGRLSEASAEQPSVPNAWNAPPMDKMTPLAPLSHSMDDWTCKYCGLENPKEARYCQHCGGYR